VGLDSFQKYFSLFHFGLNFKAGGKLSRLGHRIRSCRNAYDNLRALALRTSWRCNNEAGGNQVMTSSYLVICERGEDGTVSAYAPELQPGAVVSTGRDYEEARKRIAEAIALYLDEIRN
jgi:predicted RNase H-like HicB family nuclease